MFEEGWVVESCGEGNSLRFIDMICEVGWMAKLRMAIGDLLPKIPRTAVAFAPQDWCGVHRAQTGSLGHGSQGDDYIIPVTYPNFVPVPVAFINNTLHSKALGVMAEAEISGISG
jgi:hypothetical protein